MGSRSRGGGGAGGCFLLPAIPNIANKTTLSWIKELIEDCTGSGEHETRCCNLCTYHLQCAGSEWKHRGDPGAALPAEVRLCGVNDIIGHGATARRKKRFVLQGSR